MLEHELFFVLFLDAQHRLIGIQPLFRGTATQTSVDSRGVVKESLVLNAAAAILADTHPLVATEPSRADEYLMQTSKTALALVDMRVRIALALGCADSVPLPQFESRGGRATRGAPSLPPHLSDGCSIPNTRLDALCLGRNDRRIVQRTDCSSAGQPTQPEGDISLGCVVGGQGCDAAVTHGR